MDLLHYTPAVNRLIAERLYPSIARSLGVSVQTTAAPVAAAALARVESEVQIAADPSIVFAYFTNAPNVVRWMGRSARVWAAPDGAFHVEMSANTWVRATFVDVDPPRRLALAWRWDSTHAALPAGTNRVEITFAPRRGGTLVRVVHTGVPALSERAYRDGWSHYLTRLSVAAAGRDPGPDVWFTHAEATALRAQ